jgi:hypothetical protein
MQLVRPIEEVLAEFRNKYNQLEENLNMGAPELPDIPEPPDIPKPSDIPEPSDIPKPSEIPVLIKPKQSHATFLKIIAIQGIAAAVVAAMAVAVRVLNPDVYTYLAQLMLV